jgi:ABC-type multidrug transport system fused ATPase/permease subunit
VARVHPVQLAVPLGLSLLSAACEAASFALLIPLSKSIGRNSVAALESSPAIAAILRRLPDSVANSGSRATALIMIILGLIFVARVGKLLVDYLRTIYVAARTERYHVDVSAATFSRVLSFGRQYFDRKAIGAIDAEIGRASSVVRLLLAAEECFRYTLQLVVKAVVMVAISLPLAIAFTVSLPIVSWFMRWMDSRVGSIAKESMEAESTVRSRILDILGSIPLVKVNSQEREAASTYIDGLNEAKAITIRRNRVTSLRYPLEEIFIILMMLMAQTAVMVSARSFSPGDLVGFGAFLFIVQQALPDFRYLSMFRVQIAEEWPRLRSLADLFSDADKFVVPSGPLTFTPPKRAIEISNLSFAYQPGVEVLHNVRATIEAGKVTAIVGYSGAGKTSLVDLIARLYDCPPGTITVDGVDIREFSLASLHARMALVSQDVWLLNRTLRDNLTFGLNREVTDEELLVALGDVELRPFFDGLQEGFKTNIGDRGVRLSGGQRQRLALARALLRDPDILILDEATSALDSVIEQRVARAIQRRAAGRTLIVIAHRLSTIRDADTILVMDNGRVVEQGSWDQLLTLGGLLHRLHQAQSNEPTAEPSATRT